MDGRYAKMIQVGVKVMRQCIESALAKHKTVRVINVIGNHDHTGAIRLSRACPPSEREGVRRRHSGVIQYPDGKGRLCGMGRLLGTAEHEVYCAAFRVRRGVPTYHEPGNAEGGGIAPTLWRWCLVREPRERVFHLMYEPPAHQSRAAVPRIFVRRGWGVGREVHISALAHEREGYVE